MEWFVSFPDLSRGPTRQRSHNTEISAWSPPPIGWVKYNYDASHFQVIITRVWVG